MHVAAESCILSRLMSSLEDEPHDLIYVGYDSLILRHLYFPSLSAKLAAYTAWNLARGIRDVTLVCIDMLEVHVRAV
jgi:hypothetical protein